MIVSRNKVFHVNTNELKWSVPVSMGEGLRVLRTTERVLVWYSEQLGNVALVIFNCSVCNAYSLRHFESTSEKGGGSHLNSFFIIFKLSLLSIHFSQNFGPKV